VCGTPRRNVGTPVEKHWSSVILIKNLFSNSLSLKGWEFNTKHLSLTKTGEISQKKDVNSQRLLFQYGIVTN